MIVTLKTLNILLEFVFMQVADVYIGLDVMSSQMDVRVPNFRKLNLKGFSVYGMAQPARDVSKQGNKRISVRAMCNRQFWMEFSL